MHVNCSIALSNLSRPEDALTELQLDSVEDALEDFERALKIGPGPAAAHVGRAEALRGNAGDDAVLAELEIAFGLGYDDWDDVRQFEACLREKGCLALLEIVNWYSEYTLDQFIFSRLDNGTTEVH